ncbi:MAG: hypothetical protein EPN91_13150 [Salinibacterium sp.]|nr:MAG: hypothetical protein EPN91_13150 [Salinibacterium sp.]
MSLDPAVLLERIAASLMVPGQTRADVDGFVERNREALLGMIAQRIQPRPVWFASGSSRVADIRGWADARAPIGVTALVLTAKGWRIGLSEDVLRTLGALRGIPVFVDSGAFSEVRFQRAGPPIVVRPLDDGDWRQVIALYSRLVATLGAQVYVVAPDRVGDQDVTLARLTTYAAELRALRDQGANVLVAIQRGELAAADFYRRVVAVLGFEAIPALPAMKAAMTPAEVLAFVREVKPARVHLLGMGARNRKFDGILRSLRDASPTTAVSLDSNRIVAAVGRGRSPRKLTRAQDVARDEMGGLCRGSLPADMIGGSFDYTDLIGDPAAWLSPKGLARVAREASLTRSQATAFQADPMGYLAELDEEDRHLVELALEEAWSAWCQQRIAPESRRRAIASTFG